MDWNQNRFIVVYVAKNERPGYYKICRGSGWSHVGIVLLLEPSPEFYQHDDDKEVRRGFQFFLSKTLHEASTSINTPGLVLDSL